MTETERAWLAGLLEGEGCFTASSGRLTKTRGQRKYIAVYLMSTDEDVVERGAALMGVACKPVKTTSEISRKPQFRAVVHGEKAAVIMRELLPLMGERRTARIKELLEHHDSFRKGA